MNFRDDPMIHTLRILLYRHRPRSLVLSALTFTVMVLTALASASDAHAAKETGRVLSIGGAVTEIVYALGEEDRLAGRDSTSTWPEAATALPDVGYMRALSPEGVLSVKPDLILARQSSGPPEAIEVLKAADVEWVDVPDEYSAEGIDDAVRIVAEALGVPEKGDALRARISGRFEEVRDIVEEVDEPKTVLFVLSVQNGRIMASGSGTAASGILKLAGAKNMIDEFEGYKQLSDEAIIKGDPDVILMMSRGGSDEHAASDEALLTNPAVMVTTAGRNKAIIRMDGLYLLGFGPRTADAANDLAHKLYGNELD